MMNEFNLIFNNLNLIIPFRQDTHILHQIRSKYKLRYFMMKIKLITLQRLTTKHLS